MNAVLGHDSTLLRLYCVGDNLCETGPGTTWANEMNLVVKHAPGAGLIARPVDQQSNALPLCHRCVLCCIAFYCIVLYCSVLHCIILYCIVLYYVANAGYIRIVHRKAY